MNELTDPASIFPPPHFVIVKGSAVMSMHISPSIEIAPDHIATVRVPRFASFPSLSDPPLGALSDEYGHELAFPSHTM